MVYICGENNLAVAHTAQYCMDALDDAPTADVLPLELADGYKPKRKIGCLIKTADGYADGEPAYDMWECSVCGCDADRREDMLVWSYCQNCGAWMDEHDEICADSD